MVTPQITVVCPESLIIFSVLFHWFLACIHFGPANAVASRTNRSLIQHGCCDFDSCAFCAASLRFDVSARLHGGKKSRQGKTRMSWAPVYAFVKQIPRGRVITYGGLAKALRLRGGARSAGRAMAASPSGKGIPWHRVVGYGGKLLIREPYAGLQRKLLESEGVTLLESRVDMKKHAWIPAKSKRKNFKSESLKSTRK
jgi:methylated-DNA-protein-cysteine methyltransferase related protein